MLISMTGYGKAECDFPTMIYSIEIKSLNSKQLDISMKIPILLKEKELEIRNLISQALQRGKVDFGIFQDVKPGSCTHSVNREVVVEYIRQLEKVSREAGAGKPGQLIATAMRLPEAVRSDRDVLEEEEWGSIRSAIGQALKELTDFREQEGRAMEDDIRTRIKNILQKLAGISPFEKERIQQIRSRIKNSLDELGKDNATDPGRLEQEMIFYLEKYDITEEQVRLKNHCDFFLECLDSVDVMGKKLGFITQEMGREINTLGSKAYDSGIQRLVVEMKDELEKIREQILNVL